MRTASRRPSGDRIASRTSPNCVAGPNTRGPGSWCRAGPKTRRPDTRSQTERVLWSSQQTTRVPFRDSLGRPPRSNEPKGGSPRPSLPAQLGLRCPSATRARPRFPRRRTASRRHKSGNRPPSQGEGSTSAGRSARRNTPLFRPWSIPHAADRPGCKPGWSIPCLKPSGRRSPVRSRAGTGGRWAYVARSPRPVRCRPGWTPGTASRPD